MGIVKPDRHVVIKDERYGLGEVMLTVYFVGGICNGKQLGLVTRCCNRTLLGRLLVYGSTEEKGDKASCAPMSDNIIGVCSIICIDEQCLHAARRIVNGAKAY